MKKIKNFKIELRKGYILRELKKRGIVVTEDELCGKMETLAGLIKPATVYETFKPEDVVSIWAGPVSVSVSIFAVTLGMPQQEAASDGVDEAILKDAMDASVGFVEKLLRMEADKENCDLTELVAAAPTAVAEVPAVMAELNFPRISVSVEGGAMSPKHTRLCAVGWILRRKRK
jgi:hypothetical protein